MADRFEERQELLTARRKKITEKAAQAEEGLGKAASECRYHCETLRLFHSEFAHLPRLTQAVNVLRVDLQHTLQMCNKLEMAFSDVTEGKVLLGLEKWRDEEWSKMRHYQMAKTRELEHLEATVEQKQRQVAQKKAARAALSGKPDAAVEKEALVATGVLGREDGEDDEEDEDYYVTETSPDPAVTRPVTASSPDLVKEPGDTAAEAGEHVAVEVAVEEAVDASDADDDKARRDAEREAARREAIQEAERSIAPTTVPEAGEEAEPTPLVVVSKPTKKKKKKKKTELPDK